MGKKQKYHEYLGKIRSLAYPSLLIASLLGGILATISIPLVFWLSTIPQTICVVLALYIVEPKLHEMKIEGVNTHFKETFILLYRNIQLRRLGIAEIVTQGIEEVLFQVQILFYNMLWPLWAVGLTRSLMAIAKFISFRYSSKFINRFGETKVLVFNTLATRTIHLLSILFPSAISPFAMSSTGLLWGSIEIARNKLLQEQFSSKQRATMSSVLSFIGSIFAGVAGLIVGLFTDKFGVVNTLLLLQLFFVPIIFLYIMIHQTHKNGTK